MVSHYKELYIDNYGTEVYTLQAFLKIESIKRGYVNKPVEGIKEIFKKAGHSYKAYQSMINRKSFTNTYAHVASVLEVSCEYLRSLPINHNELETLRKLEFEAPNDSDTLLQRALKEREAHKIFRFVNE